MEFNKEKFWSAIHTANKSFTTKERRDFNSFRYKLWQIGDQIRDHTRFPSAENVGARNLPKLGEELMDLISILPILEK